MTEAGSATLVAGALVMLLMATTAAVSWLGGMVVAHRRAQAAADLSALAGAAHGGSCDAAAQVAVGSDAQVVDCRAGQGHVWVTVRVATPALAGLAPHVIGRAHAGPGP